ncbi:MAG: tRNA pseudouridine(13) synthase TruD [Gammaproteobacteria bacterium]
MAHPEETHARWPRAWGEPPARGLLRADPSHFQVDEELVFEPSGSGEHCLIQLRKRGENTVWIARRLARLAGLPLRDVGYAGLKDRHAVATQWFSVRLAGKSEPDWTALNGETVQVLCVERHHRKLRPGAVRRNRFRILISDLSGDEVATGERLSRVAASGVPNYFGEQRFGWNGENLRHAAALFTGAGQVPDRKRRGIYLSAARSWLFNEILARRVEAGSWDRPMAGDVLGLDGRSAVFSQHDDPDPEIVARASRLELHPTGPLWGAGDPPSAGDVRDLEMQIARENGSLAEGLVRFGLKQERRALRLRVTELTFERSAGTLLLGFSLYSGSYATSVLREIVRYTIPDPSGGVTSDTLY